MWAWKYGAVLAGSRAGDGLRIDGTQDDAFVQAAEPVAFQIDGDEPESEARSARSMAPATSGSSSRAISSRAELDARDLAVMADAEHAKAERAHGVFRLLDDLQLFLGHFREVRNARRQTRRRRLVPRRQAGLARQRADVVLGQPGLVERADDAELARGAAAGTVVAAVVGVVAVGDGGEAALAGQRVSSVNSSCLQW